MLNRTIVNINEGGWRIYIQTESASGNPEVTRGMWVHLSTNIFQGVWIYSKASFPLNTWVHVCVTWDGNATPGVGGLKLYWDAVEQDRWIVINSWNTNAINSSQYTATLWGCQYTSWHPAGAMPDNPPTLRYFFTGLMTECLFSRTEYNAAEVAELYNGGRPTSPLHVGRLNGKKSNAYWRMGANRDGSLWFLGYAVSWGRWRADASARNAFWANATPDRESTDIPT